MREGIWGCWLPPRAIHMVIAIACVAGCAPPPPVVAPLSSVVPAPFKSPTFAPTATLDPAVLPPRAGDTRVIGGAPMVFIPAGEFRMGSTEQEIEEVMDLCPGCKRDWFEDEKPQRTIYLDSFWLDKFEATNAQFQQFVETTGYQTQAEKDGQSWAWRGAAAWERVPGANWRAPRGPGSSIGDRMNHPVVQLAWEDARAFCAWAGKRLPTEAEWEKAARGTDGRGYPWGNVWAATRANFCDKNCPLERKDKTVEDGYTEAAPVGSFPTGSSPYGALDMGGNVYEWIADWYDRTYYANSPQRNPLGPPSGESRVLRGGAWDNTWWRVRAAHRNWAPPELAGGFVGLRCAQSLS